MMLELKKAVDRMTDDIRENSSYRRRGETGTSDELVMKLKGKMGDLEIPLDTVTETVDRSKYKKLEISLFLDKNPESWVYHAENFFEINELLEVKR